MDDLEILLVTPVPVAGTKRHFEAAVFIFDFPHIEENVTAAEMHKL
ncbi:MAG: hypothetical protein Q7T81_14695 [Pseudolabrys sp.]|nr:hypothetical protein [Pseudolabrys sp.]